MYYVYILQSICSQNRYIGFTGNLRLRIQQHNAGECFATAPYRPWKIAFYAAFEIEQTARDFERYLKSGSGFAFARKRFLTAICQP
jgi:putative endonuclease